jgi:hypothetical protein
MDHILAPFARRSKSTVLSCAELTSHQLLWHGSLSFFTRSQIFALWQCLTRASATSLLLLEACASLPALAHASSGSVVFSTRVKYSFESLMTCSTNLRLQLQPRTIISPTLSWGIMTQNSSSDRQSWASATQSRGGYAGGEAAFKLPESRWRRCQRVSSSFRFTGTLQSEF